MAVVVDAKTRRFGQKSSPKSSPETLAVPNFGVRSAGLRVAAQKTGCTSGILASRATPAYIYTQGSSILESRDILAIIDFRN